MGLPLNTTWKLQLAQNVMAQAAMDMSCSGYISTLLHVQHWLPVGFRVQFMGLVTTRVCLFEGPCVR